MHDTDTTLFQIMFCWVAVYQEHVYATVTGLANIVASAQQMHRAACASTPLLFFLDKYYSLNCYKYYSLTCYNLNSEIFARVCFRGSFVKIKPLGNSEITLSLNHILVTIVYVEKVSFNAIRENKIPAKNSEITNIKKYFSQVL